MPYLDSRIDVLSKDANSTERSGKFLVDTTNNLSPDHLNALRQTLINLPAFTQATWELVPTKRPSGQMDTTVQWTFEESRTLFPVLNFGGIEGNTYYQLGFHDIHFRGRGQRLTAYYQNNAGEHNYSVALRNPSYRGSRWGYSLENRRYAAVEPVYFTEATVDYRYSNQSLGAGFSYALTQRQSVSLGFSTFRERYRKVDKLSPDQSQSPGPEVVDQRKFLLKAGYTRDHLDHFEERVNGSHHQTSLQAVRTVGETNNFLIVWHDFRYYHLAGSRANLALRLRTGISSNDETPFAPFVLDSQINIRGSGNRIDRGTAQLILNLEYRYSVWRDRRERFAVQAVGFSDLGTWRNPGGDFGDLWARESIRHFVGGGIRLNWLKAQNATLRLDYGVDVRNKNERGFVAGFGQYF